jgi:hypothetical protein
LFEGLGGDLKEDGFRKVCGFLKQEKEVLSSFLLFFCFENSYSLFFLIFEDAIWFLNKNELDF